MSFHSKFFLSINFNYEFYLFINFKKILSHDSYAFTQECIEIVKVHKKVHYKCFKLI